ncbi:oxidoreductase [Candidatus Poribacteria bacterium]|nr:oxidoreductase [Candidatus Poribacteria bacterium]
MPKEHGKLTRRDFIAKSSAASAAFTIVPRHVLGGLGYAAPSDTLNLALIGAGGHGAFLIDEIVSQTSGIPRDLGGVQVVAVCDVDEKRASETTIRTVPFTATNDAGFKRFPKAPQYADFRKLLDSEEKHIDAVVVATPDHTHIPASVMAMRMGKHCYCEKPLGHNIHEVRLAAEVSREAGVATQMSIGNHGSEAFRDVVELTRAGAIGEVREVHVWCDEAWGNMRRPAETPPVPKHLDWDLWLGPAPYRPYHPIYHPGSWRDWWDFGNGRLGDIGCHALDLPFWALDLEYPLTVEAEGPPLNPESTSSWLEARWTFPARGDLPPVELTWYHGGKRPELLRDVDLPDWPVAILFVGSDGMLITEIEVVPPRYELHPKRRLADYLNGPQAVPRSVGLPVEWLQACKTGASTSAGFDYSGPLTETVLLGNVAYRVGEKLEWDAANLEATNCPEADRFIRREYRQRWAL